MPAFDAHPHPTDEVASWFDDDDDALRGRWSSSPRAACNVMPAMNDRPSKREQSEATIERILESALTLMVTRGFNATTVDDIAKSAGITKGAIYFHFENKTAVMLALLDVIERLVIGGLMDRVLQAGNSSRDKLVAALHSQGMLAETKAKYLLLFTLTLAEFNGTGSTIETRVKSIYDAFVQAIERIIRAGMASGEFRTDLGARELTAHRDGRSSTARSWNGTAVRRR